MPLKLPKSFAVKFADGKVVDQLVGVLLKRRFAKVNHSDEKPKPFQGLEAEKIGCVEFHWHPKEGKWYHNFDPKGGDKGDLEKDHKITFDHKDRQGGNRLFIRLVGTSVDAGGKVETKFIFTIPVKVDKA
jgi:hypothetical protein